MYQEDFLQNDLLYFYHNVSDEPSNGYQLHCHTMYEVFFFMEGDIEYRVEGVEYLLAPGSLLLIAPNVFHGVKIRSSRPYHRFSVHFLPELLEESVRSVLLSPFTSSQIYYPLPDPAQLEKYYYSILDCLTMEEFLQPVALKSRFIALLTQIYTLYRHSAYQPASQNRLIQDMLLYLNGHLSEPITLEELSRRFFTSKNHLNLLFRKATGTTVMQYLRIKRLALARKEILEGTPAGTAAMNAGFSDYSNFYRAYKESFGEIPSEKRMHFGK